MSKDEICTCKECKNTVFHCQICKYVRFCCRRRRGCLSSLLKIDCRNAKLHFQMTFSLPSPSCLLKLPNVMEKANRDHPFYQLYFLFKLIATTYNCVRPPVRDLQGLECPNYLKALMPFEINCEEAILVSLQECRNLPQSSCIGTLIKKDKSTQLKN